MLNLAIGTALEDGGRTVLRTNRGPHGHAIYGPYEYREPGRYAVEFGMRRVGPARGPRGATVVAIDVVRDAGSDVVAFRQLRPAELDTAWTSFRLEFTLATRSKLEYRVWTSGALALDLQADPRVVRLDEPLPPPVAMVAAFPEPTDRHPPLFAANLAYFRQLFDRGVGLGFRDDAVVVSYDGVFFHAREQDDLAFVGEVFDTNVYNVLTGGPACVIDIGMNIGLSTLRFARNDRVREVHSFEPFPSTHARAVRNLALNPALAGKVSHACVGLSDHDWRGPVAVDPANNSGSNSILATLDGPSATVSLADAGRTLAPIIERARGQGLRIVVKMDCEGSEFAIFRSLAAARLLERIDAVMVEWHPMFDQLNQQDLIQPLLAAGFIVFDRSASRGNGFFYGVRAAAPA